MSIVGNKELLLRITELYTKDFFLIVELNDYVAHLKQNLIVPFLAAHVQLGVNGKGVNWDRLLLMSQMRILIGQEETVVHNVEAYKTGIADCQRIIGEIGKEVGVGWGVGAAGGWRCGRGLAGWVGLDYLCGMLGKLTGWDDTIVALATPPGIGAIGVIRVSGPATYAVVSALFVGKDLSVQPSHTLHLGVLKEAAEALDEVVVSLFRAPRSYTGEDVIEISCHGSPVVLERVIGAVVRAGARMARAGEFTQRAFLNGKLDLAQAEAVGDLIASQSAAAARAALHTIRGGFSRELRDLREQLISFSALIELELRFFPGRCRICGSDAALSFDRGGFGDDECVVAVVPAWECYPEWGFGGDCGEAECGEIDAAQYVVKRGTGNRLGDCGDDEGYD